MVGLFIWVFFGLGAAALAAYRGYPYPIAQCWVYSSDQSLSLWLSSCRLLPKAAAARRTTIKSSAK